MSTHNICFRGEIRKILTWYPLLSRPTPGCQKPVITSNQTEAIHHKVLNDRRVTVQYIADTMGNCECWLCSYLTVRKTIHGSPMLTSDRTLKRLDISETLLDHYWADPAKFFKRFVTQDETWVQHFDTQSKSQSKQWKNSASLQVSCICWQGAWWPLFSGTVRWMLRSDFKMQKGQTINWAYYALELRQLKEACIKTKRKGKLRSGYRPILQSIQHKCQWHKLKDVALNCGPMPNLTACHQQIQQMTNWWYSSDFSKKTGVDILCK